MRTFMGDFGEEAVELSISLGDRVDVAAREEALAQVADGPLDLALVLRSAHGAEARLNSHCGAKLQEHWVEAHRIGRSLKHDGFGIIEEPLPGDAAKSVGRADE